MKDNFQKGNRTISEKYAAMGIRTPVVGVKGRHDWPDYTIAANAFYDYLSARK